MTYVDWQLIPNRPGGRSIEVPFIRRALREVRNSTIVDYGCLREQGMATDDYEIHFSNQVIGVDCRTNPRIQGHHLGVDITEAPIPACSVDVGLCVSVIEHAGMGRYGDRVAEGHDMAVLRKMAGDLKPEGVLYLTFPMSDHPEIIDGWIRCYTPQNVRDWAPILPGHVIELTMFQRTGEYWYQCFGEELEGAKHYTPGTDINAVGAATIRRLG